MCWEVFQSGDDTCVAVGCFRRAQFGYIKPLLQKHDDNYTNKCVTTSIQGSPVVHDGQSGQGVGLSRPFTQEEGKYKIQFVTDEPEDSRGVTTVIFSVSYTVFQLLSAFQISMFSGLLLWSMKYIYPHITNTEILLG